MNRSMVLKNRYIYCDRRIHLHQGPRHTYNTAHDIISPTSVEIVDTTQHLYIANLTEPISLCIGLQIRRDRGYRTKLKTHSQNRSYPRDAVSMPVRSMLYLCLFEA
ncbi:unnamed protein product [Musa hybrid cultivar]